MTHVTCRLTAKDRDQLRNPALGNRVRATFTLLMLLCTVSGLDNFEVLLSNEFPAVGSPVEADSYWLCARYQGQVSDGGNITVSCGARSLPGRYVIVRSLDTTSEHLCIAEVAVYASMQLDPRSYYDRYDTRCYFNV